MDYWDHIERVQRARSLQDVQSLTAAFATALGFRNHGYALQSTGSPGVAGEYHHFHDFADDWGATYRRLANAEAQRLDPRVMQAKAGFPAAAWDRHGRTSYEPPTRLIKQRTRHMLHFAGEFGLASGITVPSWSPSASWSFLTLTTDLVADPRELASTLPSVVYFASCLQATVDRLQLRTRPAPQLSPREVEALRWSAVGKTSWEISMILGISERTVNFHLQQAAAKLRVKGRRAACARAVALGLIAI